MHVFRSDRERADPDLEVRGKLLSHLRDVGRRRNDKGTVYPLIEVQTAAHVSGGYIHPTHRRTIVFTAGLTTAEASLLFTHACAAMKESPPLPTERSHPILGDVYVGEARAVPDVMRIEDFVPRSSDSSGVLMRARGAVTDEIVIVPFSPLLDALPWHVAANIIGHVLYDPRGVLTGWGHRLQMDGHTIAFHLPSTQRCLRLTARVEKVTATRLQLSVKHFQRAGKTLLSFRGQSCNATADSFVSDERKLSCGCSSSKPWMFTRKCTCSVATEERRSLCVGCVNRGADDVFFASADCIRTCESLNSPVDTLVRMSVSPEIGELLRATVRSTDDQGDIDSPRSCVARRHGDTLVLFMTNWPGARTMTTHLPLLLRRWGRSSPLQKITVVVCSRIDQPR